MNTFEALLLLGLIILLICLCNKQKKEEYNKKVKEIKDFDIACSKNGNRRLLEQFGEDKLQSVKNNTDTKLVEPLDGWEDRLRGGYPLYK